MIDMIHMIVITATIHHVLQIDAIPHIMQKKLQYWCDDIIGAPWMIPSVHYMHIMIDASCQWCCNPSVIRDHVTMIAQCIMHDQQQTWYNPYVATVLHHDCTICMCHAGAIFCNSQMVNALCNPHDVIMVVQSTYHGIIQSNIVPRVMRSRVLHGQSNHHTMITISSRNVHTTIHDGTIDTSDLILWLCHLRFAEYMTNDGAKWCSCAIIKMRRWCNPVNHVQCKQHTVDDGINVMITQSSGYKLCDRWIMRIFTIRHCALHHWDNASMRWCNLWIIELFHHNWAPMHHEIDHIMVNPICILALMIFIIMIPSLPFSLIPICSIMISINLYHPLL